MAKALQRLLASRLCAAFILVCLASGLFKCGPCLADSGLTVPQYGLFEVSFHCPDMTGNPFDPAANDVWATLNGQHGHVRIPAFWDGDGVWKARFSPENTGSYSVTFTRNGVDETLNAISPTRFTCVSSASLGFVRTTAPGAAWPHFVFDSGATYFPIGMDTAWGGADVLDYPELFQVMSKSDMNFARVWMTYWDGKALDWAPSKADSPPLGVYRLDAARTWDSILMSASSSNVYVQMTLQHHGQVTRIVDPNWSDSPYNIQNPGGFLTNPNDFFTDPRAIALTKAKYRYIIARYAWCSHLLGWEVFNEIQNDSDLDEPDYIRWHQQMIAYIRSVDPYHHLITTSYSDPTEKLAQQTSLDYYQPHTYPVNPSEYFRGKKDEISDRPLFWGEFGASGVQTERLLHDGLWAGMMDPCAGAPEFWYWDHVQHENWWGEFKSAAAFANLSGLISVKDSKSVPVKVATEARGPLHLTPGLGWAAEAGDGVVRVDPAGTATGMQKIPSFIQGHWHAAMMPHPLTVETDYSNPVMLHVKISKISAGGAHLSILVDGQPAAERDLPGTGQDSNVDIDDSVTINPGKHTIVLSNVGNDWFVLGDIVLDNAAPAADCMVRTVDKKYLFWVNRTKEDSTEPLPVSLVIGNVPDSSYVVHLFNTQAGLEETGPLSTKSANRTLTIPVTISGHDVAGWIVPQR